MGTLAQEPEGALKGVHAPSPTRGAGGPFHLHEA